LRGRTPRAGCCGAGREHSLGASGMIAVMTGALLGFAVLFAPRYGIMSQALRRRLTGAPGLARET
ncbi:MAG: hypothetical protein ACREH3_07150, partial [Geminicoccales bacterium]